MYKNFSKIIALLLLVATIAIATLSTASFALANDYDCQDGYCRYYENNRNEANNRSCNNERRCR